MKYVCLQHGPRRLLEIMPKSKNLRNMLQRRPANVRGLFGLQN